MKGRLKIKVICSHFGDLPQKEIVANNIEKYCDLHGYEHVINFSPEIPGLNALDYYWAKMDEIKRNLFNCDYLLWIDSDVLIYDMQKRVTEYITSDFDFDLMLACENTVQTGSYFFKNSEYSLRLIDIMIDFGKVQRRLGIYCDDTLALIGMLDTERYMGHGLDKIVSTHADDIEFLKDIENERKAGLTGDLLSHIKLVSNYSFMVKHVHVYQCDERPFLIHIPGSTKEAKYEFIKFYSENIDADNWRELGIVKPAPAPVVSAPSPPIATRTGPFRFPKHRSERWGRKRKL